MAESITQQDLENVKEDIEDIGQSSNERMVINPRYGAPYKSIPLLSDELQDAIEAAASAGAGENGWTDLLIQTADGSTQRAKNSSFQSQINQKATTAYLDSALADQTQMVNDALSQLSTQASKFYPTLAEANADIANIEVNQPVQVGESGVNGGLYYKATAEATSLTKSPYDPLEQAKADATTKANAAQAAAITAAAADATTKANAAEVNAKSFTKDSTDIFDVSAYTGNYNLSFADAVAAIPSDLKKRFLTIRYNISEVRTYINDNLTTNWTRERFWIRQTDAQSDGKLNHIDERMFYSGFSIESGSTVVNDPLNTTIIIPIRRTYTDGVENKITISASPMSLAAVTWGFLGKNGTTISTLGGRSGLTDVTIPSNASYVYANLERNNAGNISGAGNVDIAKKYLRYIPDNTSPTLIPPSKLDGAQLVKYSPHTAISKDYLRSGAVYTSPFFVDGTASRDGLHISQVVKHIEIQKGQNDLINKLTGLPRRFIIYSIIKKANNEVDVFIISETESGVVQGQINTWASPSSDGFVRINWARSQDKDTIVVRLVIDPSQIPVGTTYFGEGRGEIHPNIVLNASKLSGKNKGVQFTQFDDVGVARKTTNLPTDFDTTQPVTLVKSMLNGALFNTITGSGSIDHQQATLIANKWSRFSGKANIYVDVKANYPNNPVVKMLREEGGAPYKVENPTGLAMIGKTMPSQWIHPDTCYAPSGVGGYLYWMVNSNFPNSNELLEDPNLFVSNNGTDWTRVRGFTESEDGGVGFKLPQIFWNSNYADGFMSIPNNSNTLEFAFESTIESKKITAYLAHDPAISFANGYINVYVPYNFGVINTAIQHKYLVCYRTGNGIDWEIVREDGSTIPYNETNALKVFSKTGGVRNHIRYLYKSGGVTANELSPQVVKVSDNEWYYYAREGSSNMNLTRWFGTNPYIFDWSNPQSISKNNTVGGGLWHFCMRYYDSVYYCMTHGYMFTSTDGINFTTTEHPFFWKSGLGMLYKPSFVVGHDGKVKIAQGVESRLAVPHPYNPQDTSFISDLNRIQQYLKISCTLISEYNSLSDIMNRSSIATVDAYVDVLVMSISQMTSTIQIRLLPCLRSFSELANTIDVDYDAEIYVTAYLNTRNGGEVQFGGIALTLPNAI